MELKGKIIDFLGDSITEGVGVEDIENCRYDNRLKKKYNLKAVYNYGVSGTRIAHQIHPSDRPRHDLCFCGRSYDLYKNADIIVVYGGVNDYFHGDAPFGAMKDTTPATFCGGVEFLMNNLKSLYPDAVIVFMTPARHSYDDTSDELPSPAENKYPDAKPLKAYAEVIKEKGIAHGIFVLDLYEKLPIGANICENAKKYTIDGLHFNDEGHKYIADLLGDFLISL